MYQLNKKTTYDGKSLDKRETIDVNANNDKNFDKMLARKANTKRYLKVSNFNLSFKTTFYNEECYCSRQ